MLLAQHDDMVRALAPDTAPVLSRPAKLQGFLAQIDAKHSNLPGGRGEVSYVAPRSEDIILK